jgi:hypothetical protein
MSNLLAAARGVRETARRRIAHDRTVWRFTSAEIIRSANQHGNAQFLVIAVDDI